MSQTNGPSFAATLPRDLTAGLVVFLVALPLCLGVALASGAPLFSGLLAGIIGGILVGSLSGSQTSISGPAAGLIVIVAAQIVSLGSFPTFLLAVVLAGLIQIGLGLARAGFIAAFFPSSVIKGLLAGIGVLLILKQIPHVIGHDLDPQGDLSFHQPDHENTFSELARMLANIHPGAATIGLLAVAVLLIWGRWRLLKDSPVPAPLVVVLMGVGISLLFQKIGGKWVIEPSHLVEVPVAKSLAGFLGFLQLPDFSQWSNPEVYRAAGTIAVVASLETLLNLEAVDKLDPQQRKSPRNRELVAQGLGNIACGLIGGLPVTAVIVRSTIGINAGSTTKRSAVVHGILLLVSVVWLPVWINCIPLSCLAAILLVTGIRLVNPELVRRMWSEGRFQFVPFVITVIGIVMTDLMTGILIGLATSIGFILFSNMRRPMRRFVEKHLGGDVLHIELANQVSFLNRAALSQAFDEVPRGGQVLLDAKNTNYIDPDVLDLIRDFKEQSAPARGVEVSLIGFRNKYQLQDEIQYVDYSTRELQESLTPQQVLQILKEGHERFRTGRRLTRDVDRQVDATAGGQHPIAVVLGCIDSRTPAELIFDLGMGDVFVVRVAGNITSRKILGSVEYACAVAGAKLILVMGHTRCGAVGAAFDLACTQRTAADVTGCQNLDPVVNEIQQSIDPLTCQGANQLTAPQKESIVTSVARRNVLRVVDRMREQSKTIDDLVSQGRIAIAAAMYDVTSGEIEFLNADSAKDGKRLSSG